MTSLLHTWTARIVGLFCLVLSLSARAEAAPQHPPSDLFTGTDTVVYVDADAVGSVRLLTDTSGNPYKRYDYTPFGGLWNSDELKTSLAFAWMERDPALGQDYAAARYFEANIGRFRTVNPGHVGGNVGDPQSWHGYAYARNNPLRFFNPTGESCAVIESGGEGPCERPTFRVRNDTPSQLDLNWWRISERNRFWAWRGFDMDTAHSLLDGLGWVPGFGEVADIANAALYLAQGDIKNAGISGLAVLPVIGQLATGSRMAARAGVVANAVRKAPTSLAEQLVLKEARAGAGTRIMLGKIKDAARPENIWAKMQHTHTNPGGSSIVVHYWQNIQTGIREGFKFK